MTAGVAWLGPLRRTTTGLGALRLTTLPPPTFVAKRGGLRRHREREFERGLLRRAPRAARGAGCLALALRLGAAVAVAARRRVREAKRVDDKRLRVAWRWVERWNMFVSPAALVVEPRRHTHRAGMQQKKQQHATRPTARRGTRAARRRPTRAAGRRRPWCPSSSSHCRPSPTTTWCALWSRRRRRRPQRRRRRARAAPGRDGVAHNELAS